LDTFDFSISVVGWRNIKSIGKIKMKYCLTTFISLFVAQFTLAASALYLPMNAPVDWIRQYDQNSYEIYFKVSDQTRHLIVPRSEISLRSKDGVQDFQYGWTLRPTKTPGQFEPCFVTDIFENAQVRVFCDLIENSRLVRRYDLRFSSQFISQVPQFNGFKKGDFAKLKEAVGSYKNGTQVKVRAVFANGTALIEKNNIENFFMSGPYYDAISIVVDLNSLKLK
jgi:hypothetical protein